MGQRRRLKKPWAGEKENKNALLGCVWVHPQKRLERPHPELVHWWLLVHSSHIEECLCKSEITSKVAFIDFSDS